jgi:aspartate/methionine/tyrosine aminotransferase
MSWEDESRSTVEMLRSKKSGLQVIMNKRHNYSLRSQAIRPFKAMTVLARANQLETEGRSVIHLEVGQPDFPVLEPIVSAASAAISQNKAGYSDANGLPALRLKIAQYYADYYGLNIDERRIIITAGASGALALVAALLTDPGDGWLLTDPGYPSNRTFIEAFSGVPQFCPVGPETRFQLSAAQAAECWQASTKNLLLASPANPTGTSLDQQNLADLAGLVASRGGHLVSDEIYQGLEYGSTSRLSALSVDHQAFVINSFSKFFGMTGWRLGWLVAPEDAIDSLIRFAQNLFICASVPAQHGAVAAFNSGVLDQLHRQRDILQTRRDFVLAELPGVGLSVPITPDGAFYVYAKLPNDAPACEDYCQTLLELTGVAITPGTDFGDHNATRYIRLSYAQPQHQLEQALERLAGFRP